MTRVGPPVIARKGPGITPMSRNKLGALAGQIQGAQRGMPGQPNPFLKSGSAAAARMGKKPMSMVRG